MFFVGRKRFWGPIIERLASTWPPFFSPSKRCKVPELVDLARLSYGEATIVDIGLEVGPLQRGQGVGTGPSAGGFATTRAGSTWLLPTNDFFERGQVPKGLQHLKMRYGAAVHCHYTQRTLQSTWHLPALTAQ